MIGIMNNEDLALEKLKIIGMYACVRVTPYMEFKDGTKGSVLLLRYNADDSLVVIINSPERTDEYEHGKNNTLYPSEADQFYAYRQACMEMNEGHYCISKDWFNKYGIVVLTDVFISAVIADFICANLNTQKQDPRHITNWNTSRTENMLSQALHGCTMSDIQDELIEFMGEDYAWQRAIILETLGLFHADKIFLKNIDLDWKKIRNKYAEWLSREEMTLKLCFAEQLLRTIKEQPNCDWQRLLEKTMRKKKELTMNFRYSRYGVQELIGLYALSKYYYTEMPDTIVGVQYAHVAPQERIHIFQEYYNRFTDEMLVELFAEDDPLRVTEPTRDEAEVRAKLRIAALRGKQPEGLSIEQKDTCSKYEEGFCGKYGIGHEMETLEKPEPNKDIPQTINNYGTINQYQYFGQQNQPEQEQRNEDTDKSYSPPSFFCNNQFPSDVIEKNIRQVINLASSKADACRRLKSLETQGYIILSNVSDERKAELINPFASPKYTFCGDDFTKARNRRTK